MDEPECGVYGVSIAGGKSRPRDRVPPRGGLMGTMRIGKYIIDDQLGQGGMGVVYLAHDSDTGHQVAVKTLRAVDQSQCESIRREIRVLKAIDHPGIVRVLDEGIHEGLPWYAMEFLRGNTLRAVMTTFYNAEITGPAASGSVQGDMRDVPTRRSLVGQAMESRVAMGGTQPPGATDDIKTYQVLRESTLQPQEPDTASSDVHAGRSQALPDLGSLLSIISDLCATLAWLHGEGIVHRDLKPENIWIRPNGTPVLFDFGLVTRFSGGWGRETFVIEHSGAGTVKYIAPEQIRGEYVDARADLYSLGCILYEMLTGSPPFIGETVRDVLGAHLWTEPASPSTRRPELTTVFDELVLRLLAKDPRQRIGHADILAARLRDIARLETSDDSGHRTRSYLYRSRFTGRDDAMERFQDMLARLKSGTGGMVVVEGESGVGKTRLLMEYGQMAARQSLDVLTGECDGREGKPLQAFLSPLQVLADRCRERGPEETELLFGQRLRAIAAYVPSLLHVPAYERYEEPFALTPDATRLRLYSWLVKTFEVLSRRQPVLLLIDDLHWADELSIGVIDFFLRTRLCQKAPLLVVMTCRSDEKPAFLSRLAEDQSVGTMHLTRLEYPSLKRMVGDMLSLSPEPEEFCRFLSGVSEGNPFFLAEYLRTAVEVGVLWRDRRGLWHVELEEASPGTESPYAELTLPRTLHALMSTRLEGIPERMRPIVETAAVIGRDVQPAVLMAVTGMTDAELTMVGRELTRRQLLQQTGSGPLRFTHHMVREIILERIEPPLAKELHRRIAEAIEHVFEPQREWYATELARHWLAAGENERARPWLVRAAREQAAAYNLRQAEWFYQQYRDILPPGHIERLVARRELAIDILKPLGRRDEFLAEIGEAIAEIPDQARPDLLMEKATTLNEAALFRGDRMGKYDEARALCHQALQLLEGLFPALKNAPLDALALDQAVPRAATDILAALLKNLAVFDLRMGKFDEAIRRNRDLLAYYQRTGDEKGVGTASINLGNALFVQGKYHDAKPWFEKHLAIGEKIADKQRMWKSLSNLGNIQHALQDFEAAERLYTRQMELCGEIGDRQGEAVAWGNLGHVMQSTGQSEKAIEYLSRYLAISEEIGDRRGIGAACSNLGRIYYHLLLFPQSNDFLRRALAIGREIRDHYLVRYVMESLAYLCRDRGDLGEADDWLAEVITLNENMGDTRYTAEARILRAEIALCRDEADAAERLIEQAEQDGERLRDNVLAVYALYARSEVEYCRENLAAACGYAERAISLASTHALSMWHVLGLLQLADCFTMAGQLRQAVKTLDDAEQRMKGVELSDSETLLVLGRLKLAVATCRGHSGTLPAIVSSEIQRKLAGPIATLENSPQMTVRIQARMVKGTLLALIDEHDEATTLFRDTEDTARKHGFLKLARQVRQELENIRSSGTLR